MSAIDEMAKRAAGEAIPAPKPGEWIELAREAQRSRLQSIIARHYREFAKNSVAGLLAEVRPDFAERDRQVRELVLAARVIVEHCPKLCHTDHERLRATLEQFREVK